MINHRSCDLVSSHSQVCMNRTAALRLFSHFNCPSFILSLFSSCFLDMNANGRSSALIDARECVSGCSDKSIRILTVKGQGGTVCMPVVSMFFLMCSCILECGQEAGPYFCRLDLLFLVSFGRS